MILPGSLLSVLCCIASHVACLPGRGVGAREHNSRPGEACVLPPYPEHGSYQVDDYPSLKPGDLAPGGAFLVFTCREGSDLEDYWPSPTCYDGKWTSNMTCLRRCSLPKSSSVHLRCVSATMQIIPCEDTLRSGTAVEAECPKGHYSERELGAARCVDGAWNVTIDNCKPAPAPQLVPRAAQRGLDRSGGCVMPGPPPHGSFHLPPGLALRPGDVGPDKLSFAYSCDEGYDISFSNFISCRNGKWGPPAKCIASCKTPESRGLRFRCSRQEQDAGGACGALVPSGARLRVTCPPGHYTEAEPEVLRCEDGNWDRLVATVCVPVLAPSAESSGQAAQLMEQEERLFDGISFFSWDLYKNVAALHQGNLIMSPLSVDVALALLSLGARGETRRSLLAALHLTPSAGEGPPPQAAYRPSLRRLVDVEGVILQMANKVYMQEGPPYSLNPAYKRDAEDIFSAEIGKVDFSNSATAARTINSWVEQKTGGKIKSLFEESSIDPRTKLVLINAVYFKGEWEKPFDPQETKKREFHLSATEKQQVDMMHLVDTFRYAEIPEMAARALELPYRGGRVSMVVLLPDTLEGLAPLEAATSARVLQALRRPREEVSVMLPKFRAETTLDLEQVLSKMGLSRIFSEEADLEGLLEDEVRLRVAEVLQKAFIEVNEEGAEAAAATGIRVFPMCGGCGPKVFNVDRPFSFFLVGEGDVLLFAGRVSRP